MHKSVLLGWVAREPEIEFSEKRQEPVCKIGLGLSQGKGKDSKFVNVVFFGDAAEKWGDLLHKGYNIVVGGTEVFDAYLKDGEARPSITIYGEWVQILPRFERRDA